jgi:hypothetical protein
VRLPVLVVHYFHHTHSGKHIHFSDFIAEHYTDHEHQDIDHHNLPFQHNNLKETSFNIDLLDFYSRALNAYSAPNENNKIISRQYFYASTALSSIWRPPRLA